MLNIFVSYSSNDFAFADKLAVEFEKLYGKDAVWIDRKRLKLTEDWWAAIKVGIEAADNFVLIMSPKSLGSPICHLEIEHAREFRKRIIFISHLPADHDVARAAVVERILDDDYVNKLVGDRNPLSLFDANWLLLSQYQQVKYPYDPAGGTDEELRFSEQFARLRETLETDLAHVRQHTRLTQRAKEWDDNERNPALLLIGNDIQTAETWLEDWERDQAARSAEIPPRDPKRPEPTELQNAYIVASRKAEDERLRYLHEQEQERINAEEAVAEAKRQLRVRQNLIVVVTLITVVLGIFAVLASIAGANATNSANIAIAQASTATVQQGQAEQRVIDAVTLVAQATGTLRAVNATATQIPPTLTQAAILRQDAETKRQIITELADVLFGTTDENPADRITRLNTFIARFSSEPIAYNSRGIVYFTQGEFDLALADFNHAIQLDPQLAQAYSNRGLIYYERNESDLALADFNHAIQLDPQFVQAYLLRGVYYYDKHEYDLAIADYSTILTIDPESEDTFNNRGNAYYAGGQDDLAIADFSSAIQINPQDDMAHFNRGNVYLAQGEYSLAIADYDRTLQMNTKYAKAYYNRGLAHYDLGDYGLAVADWDQAEALGYVLPPQILSLREELRAELTPTPIPEATVQN